MKNKASEPLNFSLANPYPARAETITCPIVVKSATTMLFRKYLATGIE